MEPSSELRLELARCLTERAIQLKAAGHGEVQLFQEAIQARKSNVNGFSNGFGVEGVQLLCAGLFPAWRLLLRGVVRVFRRFPHDIAL